MKWNWNFIIYVRVERKDKFVSKCMGVIVKVTIFIR